MLLRTNVCCLVRIRLFLCKWYATYFSVWLLICTFYLWRDIWWRLEWLHNYDFTLALVIWWKRLHIWRHLYFFTTYCRINQHAILVQEWLILFVSLLNFLKLTESQFLSSLRSKNVLCFKDVVDGVAKALVVSEVNNIYNRAFALRRQKALRCFFYLDNGLFYWKWSIVFLHNFYVVWLVLSYDQIQFELVKPVALIMNIAVLPLVDLVEVDLGPITAMKVWNLVEKGSFNVSLEARVIEISSRMSVLSPEGLSKILVHEPPVLDGWHSKSGLLAKIVDFVEWNNALIHVLAILVENVDVGKFSVPGAKMLVISPHLFIIVNTKWRLSRFINCLVNLWLYRWAQ